MSAWNTIDASDFRHIHVTDNPDEAVAIFERSTRILKLTRLPVRPSAVLGESAPALTLSARRGVT
jgi:hypothetical protein